jgi:hypothetical protein
MSSDGILADVNIPPTGTLGRIDGVGFLYSGGFIMSGKNPDGTVWANGMASASRVVNYKAGRTIPGSNDNPQIYVVDADDPPFGQSWQDWSGAVAMGADFYDGNHNGVYDPVDLNGNGKWDPNEDRPDLLGDQTAWCIFSDKVPAATRQNWPEIPPRGIDIQRTVFGFKSAGLLGNMLFIRYRIANSGRYAAKFDSVYFGVWADPDIGYSGDDLVGCDTTLNAGFTYNNGPDVQFGGNPPCFLTAFFQGPLAYQPGVTFTDVNGNGVYDPGIDVPLTTAYNVRGPVLGVDSIPGARTLGLSSFVMYIQSNPDRGDPSTATEARGYTTGHLKTGGFLNPCADPFGGVHNLPCTSVNPTFWYSGNPVTDYGWLFTTATDVRQMQNTGPFTLEVGKPIDIVVAYIVARGSDSKNSVTLAKNISTFAKFIYDRNFSTAPPPPVVKPTVITTDNSIEFLWDTYEQMTYRNVTAAYDVRFEGFEVTMYNSNSTAAVVGGQANSIVIARYDKADNINNILVEKPDGQRVTLYQAGIQMDSATYATPGVGRIRLVVSTDPFTNAGLIKGRPYYFSITGYALNQAALAPVRAGATSGDYYLSGASFIQNTANVPVILNNGIVPGIDFNNPYRPLSTATQSSGVSQGLVYFDEVSRDAVTGDQYTVSFFQDAKSDTFSTYWRLKDVTTGVTKLDSQKVFLDSLNYAVKLTDGMRVRVVNVSPNVLTPTYSVSPKWYVLNPTFVFYTGADMPKDQTAFDFSSKKSALKTVLDMRAVQIRFGPTQKAYRYVNGTGLTAGRYEYAANMALLKTDTAGGKPISPNFRKGYVDVPFQVWLKDTRYNVEKQVNCAFFENRGAGIPDGIWDPGSNVNTGSKASREFIIVFDTPYSSDTNIVYTGGVFGGTARWANGLDGWKPPAGLLSTQDSARATDKWMSALYVVPLQRSFQDEATQTGLLGWKAGETMTVPITYPFTSSDVFTYQSTVKGASATVAVKKANFDKVNVFPNPLFAYNPGTSFRDNVRADDPYVTFSNLPENVTIKIYSLAGTLLRSLSTSDKRLGPSSPFLEWDLHNQAGLRVASGMYLAIVSAPGIGDKVLKFAIIMPQKQIPQF